MNSFIDLVNSRYSCRSYKSEPVPDEHIHKILEAARLAPSACNKQPWRFGVVTSDNLRKELLSNGLIMGINMDWAKNAPVLIVLGIKRSKLTHVLAPVISGINYPLLDIGITGEHLVLQATELGLGTCWIGWIKQKKIRKLLNWPKNIFPVSIIAVGWPESTTDIHHTNKLPADQTVTWYK